MVANLYGETFCKDNNEQIMGMCCDDPVRDGIGWGFLIIGMPLTVPIRKSVWLSERRPGACSRKPDSCGPIANGDVGRIPIPGKARNLLPTVQKVLTLR